VCDRLCCRPGCATLFPMASSAGGAASTVSPRRRRTLNSEGSYEDVFEQLTDGLSWSPGRSQSWSPPTKSAIFQARSRLGYEPVLELFCRAARPLADTDTPGSWLAGRRLAALDGTCLDLPDTPANAEHFGRPASSRGEKSAVPQARLVAVAECGTHAVFDAAIGPCRTSERELAHDLMDTLEPGMLLLAGCCCSPTAASTDSTCRPEPPPPAPTCCGGSSRPSQLDTSRPSTTDPGWHRSSPPPGRIGSSEHH